MAPLLTSADYPAIRAAIDISFEAADLPDSLIELPIYLAAADMEIKARDSSWETRADDELVQLKNATIYLTAARIAPAIPRIAGEDFGNYRYKLQAVDWEARAAALRGLAEAALNSYLDTTTTPDRPTFFAVASGRRGRW